MPISFPRCSDFTPFTKTGFLGRRGVKKGMRGTKDIMLKCQMLISRVGLSDRFALYNFGYIYNLFPFPIIELVGEIRKDFRDKI
jgi:hypothetical protein